MRVKGSELRTMSCISVDVCGMVACIYKYSSFCDLLQCTVSDSGTCLIPIGELVEETSDTNAAVSTDVFASLSWDKLVAGRVLERRYTRGVEQSTRGGAGGAD